MPFFFLLLFDTTGAHQNRWWHKHPRVEDCDRVHWAGAYGWSPETGGAQGLRKHSATGTISPIPASSDPSTAKNEMVCGSVKYPGDGQAPGPWSYVRYYSWVHVDDDGSPKVCLSTLQKGARPLSTAVPLSQHASYDRAISRLSPNSPCARRPRGITGPPCGAAISRNQL